MSVQSTVLPVGLNQTKTTSQTRQTLAQTSSKVKIEIIRNSSFEYPNSIFPLTNGRTVFYQPESGYTRTLLNFFSEPRDGGINYCYVDHNNHVDENNPPYPPNNEPKSLTIEDLAAVITMNRKFCYQNENCLNTTVILYVGMNGSASL